jgi:hypothetical protein
MRRRLERVPTVTEYFTGSRSLRAVAFCVVAAIVVPAVIVGALGDSRVWAIGGVIGAAGLIALLKTPSGSRPGPLMTGAALAFGIAALIDGVAVAATGTEPRYVWDIGFAVGVSLAAVGYLLMRRRVGAAHAHRQLREWIEDVLRVWFGQDRRNADPG